MISHPISYLHSTTGQENINLWGASEGLFIKQIEE